VPHFLDDSLPRSYGTTGVFSTSANGSSILGGPAYAQKYIWAISTLMEKAEAEQVDAMYRDWDADRSAGKAVAIGVLDETFGSPVSATATFTTPPSYTRIGNKYEVSFGLTEV